MYKKIMIAVDGSETAKKHYRKRRILRITIMLICVLFIASGVKRQLIE